MERSLIQRRQSENIIDDLCTASEMKRNKVQEQLRAENPPWMLTTLDKESQMMKVAVIQPPIKGQSTEKEITEFKLNMG